MKKINLVLGMAAIAAASSIPVQAYDSDLSLAGFTDGNVYAGTRKWEGHHMFIKTGGIGSNGCPATSTDTGGNTIPSLCAALGGFESEGQLFNVFKNKFYTDGLSDLDVNGDAAPFTTTVPTADSYDTEATGNCDLSPAGFALSSSGAFTASPDLLISENSFILGVGSHTAIVDSTPEHIGVLGTTSRPALLSLGLGKALYTEFWFNGPSCYKIDTNLEGKITGGVLVNLVQAFDSNGDPLFVASVNDMTHRIAAALICGPGSNAPTLSEWSAFIDPYIATNGLNALNGAIGHTFTGTSCSIATFAQIDYLNCDSDRGLCTNQVGGGKAVPIPTYAAALLGLGLIGVTFVTGRRRTIS